MAHQFSFYLTDEDTRALEQALQALSPLLILHSRSPSPKPLVLPSLDFKDGASSWIYFFLVRPEDLDKVVMRFVEAQDHWVVDVIRSPIIEFTKSFLKDGRLGRGRAYFKESYFDEADNLIKKEDSFILWASEVFRKAKKSLQKDGPDYVGRCAAELRTANK